MTILPQEQSFWMKVPRSSWARRQPTCLQTVSERTAYLISQGRNKQTSEWRSRKNHRNNLQPPDMASEFSIHELNCAIRQLKKKKKKKKRKKRESPSEGRHFQWDDCHLGSEAKQRLLDIYNQSWKTGTFPTSWKQAIIIHILKKGKDRHSKTIYRPISLLSCLGKTMERIVNRRLQYHLEKIGLQSHLTVWLWEQQEHRGPSDTAYPGYRKWLPAEDEDTLSTSPKLSAKYGRRVFSSSS